MQVCEDLKIASQNDTVKLAEAKQLVYLKVGVLAVGDGVGEWVGGWDGVYAREESWLLWLLLLLWWWWWWWWRGEVESPQSGKMGGDVCMGGRRMS